ncbi:unnamed protein product [Amoebophrya sp. A25]|nr:unnamed protein product [Amoebophrya sp. A25]|eukprot:GSA25T00017361001.1
MPSASCSQSQTGGYEQGPHQGGDKKVVRLLNETSPPVEETKGKEATFIDVYQTPEEREKEIQKVSLKKTLFGGSSASAASSGAGASSSSSSHNNPFAGKSTTSSSSTSVLDNMLKQNPASSNAATPSGASASDSNNITANAAEEATTIEEGLEVAPEDAASTTSIGGQTTGSSMSAKRRRKLEMLEAEMFYPNGVRKMAPSTMHREDIYKHGHTSVFGSFYNDGKWGFACCQLVGNPRVRCPHAVDPVAAKKGKK